MKNTFTILLAMILFSAAVYAQTDPGTNHLKNQWTFDDGTAIDRIAGVEGTIIGNAKLANKGFNTTSGGYMSFPASQIGINSFPALSIEVWCTSSQGKNTGWTMLSYFGDTDAGGWGRNYTFISIARAVDGSMASLETTAWDGVSGPEYDDGKLHQFIETIDEKTVKFYVDGNLIAIDSLTAGNVITNISTSHAYLGKGGWTADPDWLGIFHKYSLYDKSLSDDEILFLYHAGAEEQAVINVTQNEIALDSNYPAETINVTSSNVASDITVTAPAGIMLYPSTIPRNTQDVELAIIWDGSVAVDGNVVLSSGDLQISIPVKTADDSGCYSAMYPDDVNFVATPGLNTLTGFAGWGVQKIQNVISNPSNVYCGAASIALGNGTETGSGSLNVPMDGIMETNSTYFAKTMIKTLGGTFQLGVYGWAVGESDINSIIDTYGEWMPLVLKFTTGAQLGDFQGLFVNNWNCTGTLAYVDNWEIYKLTETALISSHHKLAFDPEHKSIEITVSGSYLTENVSIAAPSGFSIDKTSLTPDSEGKIQDGKVAVNWNGLAALQDTLRISANGMQRSIALKTTLNSNHSCFTPIFNDRANLVTSPTFNDFSSFGGWGDKSSYTLFESEDSIYCGSHCGLIDGSGSIDVVTTGKLEKNTSYQVHAKIRTFGGAFQMGAYGYDAMSTVDLQDSLDTQGEWMSINLTFTTSDTLATNNGVFINNFHRTGKRCFIDNWEIYKAPATGIDNVVANSFKISSVPGQIRIDMNYSTDSELPLKWINMQGQMLYRKLIPARSNYVVLNLDLAPGIYIVSLGNKSKLVQIIH